MAREIAEHELDEWLKTLFFAFEWICLLGPTILSSIWRGEHNYSHFNLNILKSSRERQTLKMKMVSNLTTHCLILLRKIPCIFILDFSTNFNLLKRDRGRRFQFTPYIDLTDTKRSLRGRLIKGMHRKGKYYYSALFFCSYVAVNNF